MAQSLRESFEKLPENVRAHLASENITDIVISINQDLDLIGDDIRVIPELITRLVTQQLDTKNFATELKKGISEEIESVKLENAVKRIENEILKPIKSDLENLRIGTTLPTTSAPSVSVPPQVIPNPTPQPTPEKMVTNEIRPNPQPPSSINQGPSVPTQPIIIKPITEIKPTQAPPRVISQEKFVLREQESREEKPFILHEEKPLFTPTGPTQKPSLNFEPQRFADKSSVTIKPSNARVESPNQKKSSEPRVVHYSELRTKLDK